MRAANDGDEAAWETIVDRFSGLVWATVRAHRLSPAEAADVAQTTWLRLVENLDRIKDPERLGAWLATTARRECLRHIRLRGRELPTGEDALFEAPSEDRAAADRLITRERNVALASRLRADQRALPGAAALAGRAGALQLRGDRRGSRHADRRDRAHPRPMSGSASPHPGTGRAPDRLVAVHEQ